MNGAEYIINFLERKGVTESFGYPGGQVLSLYDAIYQRSFPHTLTRHEQGAIHAAEGYARVTGKIGVVIATSGPGATNLVTGIADAYLDSTPLFVITGQVSSDSIGKDAFQEADTTGITIPITKNNYLVKYPEDLPRVLEEGWMLTTNGRHGPVLVDVAKDVFSKEIPEDGELQFKIKPYVKKAVSDETLETCLKLLKKAKRPLLLAGGGANKSEKSARLLGELAELLKIPAVNTLMGKGVFASDASYYLGMIGMHGVPGGNLALRDCDLLFTFGSRYSDRVAGKTGEMEHNRVIIQVDIDNAEFAKAVAVELPIQSDVADFLEVFLDKLKLKKKLPDFSQWLNQCQKGARENPLTYQKTGMLKPQEIMEYVGQRVSRDSAIVTDVGQHQMFAAQYFPVSRPNRFVTSGGLGTMGFGLPAAIGAAIGTGDITYLFSGDGGFQMTLQELSVVSNLGLPVKIFVIDNQCLGMVRQWQEMFYDGRYSHSILDRNPDFVTLAKAYGIQGFQITTTEELSLLDQILTTPEPVLVHCVVDPGENVYPIIPPGGGISEMTDAEGRYQER